MPPPPPLARAPGGEHFSLIGANRLRFFLLLVLLSFGLLVPPPARAELGIHVYGLSYHFDRALARERGVDNEVNPGLGVRYRIPHSKRLDWFFDAGVYRDSGRHTALVAGPGALVRISQGWRLGGALAVLKSDTYNRGRTAIAPLPLVAYELERVTLNAVFFPKVSDISDVATVGFWVTVWLR
jgi:hypothetical protein